MHGDLADKNEPDVTKSKKKQPTDSWKTVMRARELKKKTDLFFEEKKIQLAIFKEKYMPLKLLESQELLTIVTF